MGGSVCVFGEVTSDDNVHTTWLTVTGCLFAVRCVIPLMLCNKLESNGVKADNNGALLQIKITHP